MKRDVRLDRSLREILRLAWDEDLPDVTSEAVFPEGESLSARLVAKQAGIACGLRFLPTIFASLGRGVRVRDRARDGDPIRPGQLLAEIDGPARMVLAAERTALNLLQHLSGIATQTRRFVDETRGTRCRILDTRKTTPGFRRLDKYAVRCGGGENHRMGLSDAVMIKDNHVDRAGGLAAAIQRVLEARKRRRKLPLIVEVRTLEELRTALDHPVDRILLDNMPPSRMKRAVEITGGRVPLEASGGVTLRRVAAIARTGVDFISVGALTHSAPALDISLDVILDPRRGG